jgi:hypothetical protein
MSNKKGDDKAIEAAQERVKRAMAAVGDTRWCQMTGPTIKQLEDLARQQVRRMLYRLILLILASFVLSVSASAQLFSPYACPPGFRVGFDGRCYPAVLHQRPYVKRTHHRFSGEHFGGSP